MKKTCSLLFFMTFGLVSWAQQSSDKWLEVLSYGVGNQTDRTTLSFEEVQRKSDRCIPEIFATANLTLSNQTLVENVKVKYDFKDHVLIIDHAGKMHIAASNMINKLVFLDHPDYADFVNVSQMGRTYGRKGFYQILLSKGNSSLLKYRSIDSDIRYKNSDLTGLETLGGSVADTTYINRLEYLIYDSESLYPLQNLKPKSLAALNKPLELLKAYIKEEKLKFKNEDDLKKFMEYYWTL